MGASPVSDSLADGHGPTTGCMDSALEGADWLEATSAKGISEDDGGESAQGDPSAVAGCVLPVRVLVNRR